MRRQFIHTCAREWAVLPLANRLLNRPGALLAASLACGALAQAADPLTDARQALGRRDFAVAIRLAAQAIDDAPEDAAGYLIRAVAYEAQREFSLAVDDFDRTLQFQGESTQLLRRRGAAKFRACDVAGALADWDREIELDPQAMPDHWMRGIALYYVGRFADGARQFGAYQTVDGNDVENAVWHFLCLARQRGIDQARQEILPIRHDRRVPMMEVYALFRGEKSPDDVLAAAGDGATGEPLRQQLFFAHLYLALFAEAEGRAAQCLEHLKLAVGEYSQSNYMGDVARVHLAQRSPPAKQGNVDP